MDPIRNPFAPGAGTQPPELAGRDELRELVRVALERTRLRRATKSVLLIGLRGVGKTVLLGRMRLDAEGAGIHTLGIEAPEGRSLPAILAPELRKALLRLSRDRRARQQAQRALRALAGFVSALRVRYRDIEVGLDFDPEPGLADNGDLELDLQALLAEAGAAADAGSTALAMFVDEMQYIRKDELAALVTALHAASQQSLPIILLGAGLPQLPGQMGEAKSYTERLLEFRTVGPLAPPEARRALEKPVNDEGAAWTAGALDVVVEATEGYPYFLQEWGKHAWDAADDSPITTEDVELASVSAVAALDESFFRVRFDRLTPGERRYLRAMAELGPGPHRSGDVADVLDRQVTTLAPTRSKLISKGMIYSPAHGDTAFTVPLFDEFMKRIMPADWRAD